MNKFKIEKGESAELDRLRALNAELLAVVEEAEVTLAATLKARGYPLNRKPKSSWAPEIMREVDTLMLIRRQIAKAKD